jgi:hypothetical protein
MLELKTVTSMSITARIFEVFIGLVLVATGALIIYAFHAHCWRKQGHIWDIGFLLLVEAYSIVGSLFILLGLRYALGWHRFVERWISKSLRHFSAVVVLPSFAILAAMIFVFR